MNPYPSTLGNFPQNTAYEHNDYRMRTEAPSFQGPCTPEAVIALHVRLALLEKDLQTARTNIVKQEAVIQYLLQYNVNRSHVEQQCREEVAAHANDADTGLHGKFRRVPDLAAALTSSNGLPYRTRSTSTSSTICCKDSDGKFFTPPNSIDLLDLNEDLDNFADSEAQDITQPNSDDESSDGKDATQEPALADGSPNSSIVNFPSPGYIHHFANADNNRGMHSSVKAPPQGFSRSSVCLLSGIKTQESFEDAREPSPENSLSSSAPIATSLSFGAAPIKELKAFVTSSRAANDDRSAVTVPVCKPSRYSTFSKPMADVQGRGYSWQTSGEAMPSRFNKIPPSVGNGGTIPRWAVSEIFDSRQGFEGAVSINRRDASFGFKENPFPRFFNYGIRYRPTTFERDVYRTVIITNISSDVTLLRLFEKVRGGVIVDAKLLDTASITKGQTALITFLYETSAVAFAEHAKRYPVMFNGTAAQTTLISTPTWPMPALLQKAIKERGQTRCLEVHNFPGNISAASLKKDIGVYSSSLETMRMNENKVLVLRFASINAARSVAAMFHQTSRYAGCFVKYLPDPCAKPLATLLEDRQSQI